MWQTLGMFLRAAHRWKNGKEHRYWSIVENRRVHGRRTAQKTLGEINDAQLVRVEDAFRNLKGDLEIRPIYHQKESRIEAHIFVAFLAYCLHVTLAQRMKTHAPGLTSRSILEQMKAMQMLNVRVPTTDGRRLYIRYTQPDKTQQLLLAQLGLVLPHQPPPKITYNKEQKITDVVKT